MEIANDIQHPDAISKTNQSQTYIITTHKIEFIRIQNCDLDTNRPPTITTSCFSKFINDPLYGLQKKIRRRSAVKN